MVKFEEDGVYGHHVRYVGDVVAILVLTSRTVSIPVTAYTGSSMSELAGAPTRGREIVCVNHESVFYIDRFFPFSSLLTGGMKNWYERLLSKEILSPDALDASSATERSYLALMMSLIRSKPAVKAADSIRVGAAEAAPSFNR